MPNVLDFIEEIRPQTRPDWLIREAGEAFAIDEGFKLQFASVRLFLRAEMNDWADMVITNLIKMNDLDAGFPSDQMEVARSLFSEHRHAVLGGKFDEEYFTSIERIALFFIYHNVLPLQVCGSIKRRIDQLIAEIISEKSDAGGRLKMIGAIVTFLAIEINQIQRVYIAFHERNSMELFTPDAKKRVSNDGRLTRILAKPNSNREQSRIEARRAEK